VNLVELAQRLKRIRKARGMSLEDVASSAGMTRGWLSKVENFRTTPSLPALSAIARGLGVTLSELFDGLDERPSIVVVRADQREPVARDEEVSELAYESLATPRPNRRMDPFVLHVPRTDARPAMAHSGEEFMLVLKGTVTLEYDQQQYALGQGDCAYFDGDHPHRVTCDEDEPAQLLLIYARDDAAEESLPAAAPARRPETVPNGAGPRPADHPA